MFQNCPISQGYAQADAKVKYSFQFDISPHCKEQLTYNIKRLPFIFKVDQSTNRFFDKQYDGHVEIGQKASIRSWTDIVAPSFSGISLVMI